MRALKFLGILALAFGLLAVGATLHTPGHLWISSGVFAGCPLRPSCVSSKGEDAGHRVAPLHYAGNPADARQRLEAIVAAMPGVSIQHAAPQYLHATYRTSALGLRDDLELLVEPAGLIQVRSVSRFGYSDLGRNRLRVEEIRRQLQLPDSDAAAR